MKSLISPRFSPCGLTTLSFMRVEVDRIAMGRRGGIQRRAINHQPPNLGSVSG
jgi:hypothetical protein